MHFFILDVRTRKLLVSCLCIHVHGSRFIYKRFPIVTIQATCPQVFFACDEKIKPTFSITTVRAYASTTRVTVEMEQHFKTRKFVLCEIHADESALSFAKIMYHFK